MANTIFILPKLNPLKAIWQSDNIPATLDYAVLNTFNPAFNYRHFDEDFFYRNIKQTEDKTPYFQPYQNSDTLFIQWLSSDATDTNFTAKLINNLGGVFSAKVITVVEASTGYSSTVDGVYTTGLTLYTITVTLWDVPEGIYYLQLVHRTATPTNVNVLFEPIHIKKVHEGTTRLDMYNTYNDQSMIYPNSYWIPQIRVKGYLTNMTIKSKAVLYENQTLNATLVSGKPYRIFDLTIDPVPEYMADKLERALLCNKLQIDGKYFTRDEGAALEPQRVQGNPLAGYGIKLREAYNNGSTDVGYNNIVLGDMPQTTWFWVEEITIDGSVTNIANGFNGKRQFLDYLNNLVTVYALGGNYGYWSENERNELVFTAYAGYTIANSWVLDPDFVLLYGIKIGVEKAGDIIFSLDDGGSGTGKYAMKVVGTPASNISITSFVTTSIGYACTGVKDVILFFNDSLASLDLGLSSCEANNIGGELNPSLESFFISGVPGFYLKHMNNNLFKYSTTSLLAAYLDGNSFATGDIDNMIRWFYERLNYLDPALEVIIDNQEPHADPTLSDAGIQYYYSQLKSNLVMFNTD